MFARALRRVLGPVTANLLATATLITAISTDWSWLCLGLGVLTLAAGIVFPNSGRLGQYLVSRALVAAGALASFVQANSDEPDLAFTVAAGLMLVLLSMENVLKQVSTPLVDARNLRLPGRPLRRIANRTSVYYADTAMILVLAVASVVAVPTWLVLAGALVATALYGALAADSVHYRLSADHGRGNLNRALAAYRPDFYIHWDAAPESSQQVLMWLPFLERVGARYAILVRNPRSLEPMSQHTKAPVVLVPNIASVDAAIVPSLKAIFYVNNGMKNAHSVRFHELTHVQLLHGDSEKASSFNPITAMFDRIFVAGQAAIDRYKNNNIDIPAEKFRIVGRPQVENISVVRTPIAAIANKTVLYAPTWTGAYNDTNHCSLEIADRILTALLARGVTVIMRHHPLTTTNNQAAEHLAEAERILARDRAATGRRHIWGAQAGEGQFVDWVNRADVMIADISSVVSDFLFSEKPFAVTDMLGARDELLAQAPIVRGSYVVDADAGNINDVLDHLLGDDPLAEIRRQVKTYYLGDFPAEGYADAFVREARRVLARPTMGEITEGASVPQTVSEATVELPPVIVRPRPSMEDDRFSVSP